MGSQNSSIYRLITFLVVVAIGTTSCIPLTQGVPRAAASQEVMDQPEPNAPATGPQAAAPESLERIIPAIGSEGNLFDPLLSAEALELDQEDAAPAALANPLSVSRVQSSYAATGTVSDTLVITFTVINNRPPAIVPDVPLTATITETISATLSIDFSQDPNAIRDVLLTDELLPSTATFVSADPMPDRNSDSLAWSLGDIPPLGSVSAVLRVQVPGSVPDAIELDTGAVAWGTLQGRTVSAATAPAGLAPDGMDDWLIWTVDADYYDEYMVEKAAELGNDWSAMFAYVRSLGYESYKGSLRGTRGTLWSEAGNSLDQASLLIAMLRGSGIPARYRHGTLSTARAQELILSMFPELQGVVGHIPAGTEVADPATDPQLVDEATDHWWVEAYLPGSGWIDLDPSFSDATPGQSFYDSLDGTDQIAEVPDAERHKVTLTVKVEQYYPLNVGGAVPGLAASYPLTHTFNTVELAAKSVTLGHMVNTDQKSGLVFAYTRHTYTPYFQVDDQPEVISDQSFEDLVSNFPLGTNITVAEFLLFQVRDSEGNIETYQREIMDLLGFETRHGGGTVYPEFGDDNAPRFTVFDLYSTWFWPGRVPAEAAQAVAGEMMGTIEQLNADMDLLAELEGDLSPSAAELETLREIRFRFQTNLGRFLSNIGIAYGSLADQSLADLEEGLLVKAYYDAPRIVTVASEAENGQVAFNVDLRKTLARTIPYPGQVMDAIYSLNMSKGFVESSLEGQVLTQATGQPAATAARVFEAAAEQGIEAVLINQLRLLDLEALDLSAEAKARISDMVYQGKVVVVPQRPALLDGELTIGWWELDPTTGETVGVMENGLHNALLEWILDPGFWTGTGQLTSFMLGFSAFTVLFIGQVFETIVDPSLTLKDALVRADALFGVVGAATTALSCLSIFTGLGAAVDCGLGLGGADPFSKGGNLAKSYIQRVLNIDPPLPEGLIAYPTPDRAQATSVASLDAAGTFFSTSLVASLTTGSASLSDTIQAGWTAETRNVLAANSLSVPAADLYDADGALVGRGAVQATPHQAFALTAVFQDSSLQVDLAASGRAGFYAPAVSGLGVGGTWTNATVQLTATQPYTLALQDALVTLNSSQALTGLLTLVTTGTTTMEGTGHTAVPNFANAAVLQAQEAQLQVGPAAGTAQVGGAPLNVANGLALANYSGPITITEAATISDSIELSGDAHFFSLDLSPASSTSDPNTPVSFQALIAANFDDTYTTTVTAPDGWDVALDDSGLVTATPPLGTTPSDISILVTAESGAYPGLFASAVHTVTLTAYQGMEMQVNSDLLVTVPWGPAAPDAQPGTSNDGRLQLSGAAFTTNITNTSTTSHTFDISVTGLPTGWLVLSGAEGQTETSLTLPAGGLGLVGLYVSPTLTALPPVGTAYPFTVIATAEDAPALTASDTDAFVVPAIAFNYLVLDPPGIWATVNSTATFEIAMTNVGNTAGSFPLTVTLPLSTWTPISPVSSPISLTAGETHTQSFRFAIPEAEIGGHHVIWVDSPAPGTAYTQHASVDVEILSENTLQIYESAEKVAGECSVAGDVTLPAALGFLGTAINDLEGSCQTGACALDLRDRVVSGAWAVASSAESTSPLVTAGQAFRQIAAAMAGHTTPAELLADTQALGDAVRSLETEVCAVAWHNLDASFAPPTAVVLEQAPVTVDLRVRNAGSLTTTAVLTLTPPAFTAASWDTQSIALLPGELVSLSTVITPTSQGVFVLIADVTAAESTIIQHQAHANLAVVDAYLQIGNVIASPAFVEYESGTAASIYADVANVTNLPMAGDVHLGLLAADNSQVYSTTMPVSISSSHLPIRTDLGTIDTSGLVTGSYTVTVSILDGDGMLIPQAVGQGMLTVGGALTAGSRVLPDVVAPGTVTVTTIITTELSQSILDQLVSTAVILDQPAPSGQVFFPPPTNPATADPAGMTIQPPAASSSDPKSATGAAVTLVFSNVLTQTTAGAPFDLLVIAQDTIGDVDTTYTGTVALSSSDLQATLPSTTTFTAGDGGQHTFAGVILGTAGSQNLTVTDVDDGTLTDTVAIEVAAGIADANTSTFSVTSPHQADGLETSTIVVTATDSYSNPVPGATVWVVASGTGNTFTGSPGTADASGVFTATLVSTRPGAKAINVLLGDGQTMNWLPVLKWVEYTGASVSGVVFSDPDQDNVRDGGESGLGGVQVSLYESGQTEPLKTTVTASSGGYTLTGLLSGTFRVEQTRLDQYAYSGSGALTVTVSDFATSTGNDFGNYAIAQVNGIVWNDGDQDGQRGQAELPLSGVTINAYDALPALVDSTATDADGAYHLSLAADLPSAPDNFVFNSSLYSLQEPASGVIGNHDLERGPTALDPSTYPRNYDFSSGDLGDWTVSDPTYGMVVSDSHNLDGYHLLLDRFAQSAYSPPFVVPAEAQSVRFDYWNWTSGNSNEQAQLYVYVLSGEGYGISTQIGDLRGSYNQGWQTAVLDLQSFQGQTVKLRFYTYNHSIRYDRARVDSLSLNVEVPDWTTSSSIYVQVISDSHNLDGAYLRIDRFAQSAYSPPFVVPADAQSVRFDYWNWTSRDSNEQAQLYVYVLSGEGYGISTQIGDLRGSYNQGWQTAVLDLQSFQGQTVKLRFYTYNHSIRYDRARVDNLSINVETPGWMPSGAGLVSIGMSSPLADPGATAPQNTDLSLGRSAFLTETYPANYDFERGPTALDPSTYPGNYDFSSGDLGDWTVSDPTYGMVVSDSHNLDGYHLLLDRFAQSASSPPFVVPAEAQSVRFDYWNWTSRDSNEQTQLYVYVLSGDGFGISTQIGDLRGSYNQGWQTAVLDLQSFQGQTVKLRFYTYNHSIRYDRARVDNLSLNVEVPDWTTSSSIYVQVISDSHNLDGAHLRIDRFAQSAYSPPFVVPADAQSVRFDYWNWTSRNSNEQTQLYVYVLSGEGYGISTQIGDLRGSYNQGWQTAVLDLQSFQGQTVKLRFYTYNHSIRYDRARVDNLSINVETPAWTPSGAGYVTVYDGIVPVDPGVTSPENADFGSGRQSLSVSTYPTNYDFSQGLTPQDPSTYPGNYDFSSGDLGDWTVSDPTYVSVVSDTENLDGYHLLLNRFAQSAYSPPFVVPADAQSVRFNYLNWTTRDDDEQTQLYVYVLSGEGYGISTQIGDLRGSYSQGWQTAVLDLQSFQGQTVKLRFYTYNHSIRYDRARVDNLSLNVEVPDWTTSSSIYVQVVSDTYNLDGAYLRIDRFAQSAYSPPFVVPAEAQSVRFNYLNWTTRDADEQTQLYVYVLSGPDYGISTQIGDLRGSYNQGWKTAVLDLQSFQGQTVKLQFYTYNHSLRYDRARIDNLSLNVETPDWRSSSASYAHIDSTDPITGGGNYLLLDRYNTSAYSTAFLVPTNTESLRLDYSNWTERNSAESVILYVYVLSGEDWSISTHIGTLNGSQVEGWKQATLDLTPFRGRTVKLRLQTHNDSNQNGRSKVDNITLLAGSGGSPAGNDENPGDAYLYLQRYNTSATSTAFAVPADVESVGLDYLNWTDRNSTEQTYLYVYALSGESFGTSTNIASLLGSAQQGWLTATVDLSAFQEQVIKLRFQTHNDSLQNAKSKIDNIALITGASGSAGGSYSDPSGEYLYLSRYDVSAYSAPFEVPTDTLSLHLDYTSWTNRNANEDAALYIYVLSGADYGTSTQIATLWSSRNDGWQEATLGLTAYQGQTIKLRFRTDTNSLRNAKSKIDNVYLLPLTTTPYTIEEINPVNYTSSTSDTVGIDAFGGGWFTVDFGDFGVDRYQSTVEVSPTELIADGVSTAVVTITLRDGDGDPLPDYELEILAPGTAVAITHPISPTDAAGRSVGSIRSTFAPQVVLVTARTISDNVTLAASVPVTLTPGIPDPDRSTLGAAPSSVVANGVDTAVFAVTLRDQFDNLVAGKTVSVTAESAAPVTITHAITQTNATGQITGSVRSAHDQTVVLRAYDVTDDITVTQTAEVLFSSVDPQLSSVEATPSTLIADGFSTASITVTLRDAGGLPLMGKPVQLSLACTGCTLDGQPVVGPMDLGLTGVDGTATAALASSAVEVVTIHATGDGIPLDAQAQIAFTVGPVDPAASQLWSDVTTVVANGAAYASLSAILVDSYSHPVPGKTVYIQSTGTNLVLNQPITETDAQGQVHATLGSTDVQTVTLSAYDQTDNITLTQTVQIQFVPGAADASQSTILISPTTILADGLETTTITATLRDSSGHPAAGRAVQLVVTGSGNVITPAAQGNTDENGVIVFHLASTAVEIKDISLRDVPNDVTLPAGQVSFVAGQVDPDVSQLMTDKTTVLIGDADQATVTATLWDNLSHRIPGKQVQIQVTGVNVTVTQPVTLTNSLGQVQATIGSGVIQTVTVTAVDVSDSLTVTQRVTLTFVAGPADPANSTIVIHPTTVVADNLQTATITATLRDDQNNPLSNRAVQLIADGSNNTISPATQQSTDATGTAVFTLASSTAETKQVSVRDLLGEITLPAGQVTFLPGPLDTAVSTLTSNTSRGPADGQTAITVTVRTLDAMGNPLAGLPVTLTASIPGVTITQPAAPSDADGYAHGSLVGTTTDPVTVRALADGTLLDASLILTFEPIYVYAASLTPPAQTVGVGAVATFDVMVSNTGYRPDEYALSLTGLDPTWFTLQPTEMNLAAGEMGHATLAVQTTDCLDAGVYPFFVLVSSDALSNTRTITGSLTLTSEPVLADLSPADGTSIGATSALFSWGTAVTATTSVYIKPISDTTFTGYSGTAGTQHQVSVSGLSRNTSYEWYASSQSVCGTANSPTRTLNVLNGIVFTEREYTFDVQRDYNQLVSLAVYNQDIISHTVVVTLANPYPELIIGFVGDGSIDDPFTLLPGETHHLQLVVHTQDVTQSDFGLVARLTADDIQDAVPLNLHVQIPNLNFDIQQTGYNTQTLVTSYQVTNYGDPLTDLALTAEVTGTGSIYLLPAMSHGYLGTGKSFGFEAIPAIDTGFQALSGTIYATAGGVVTSTAISLSLPVGTSMFLGQAADVSLETGAADWYCTNRPVIANQLVLPPGFRRADVAKAQFFFNIDSERSWSNVRPHDVHIYLNDNEIGALLDMIPHGMYIFPLHPDTLNESLVGPSINNLRLETLHLNGGHYVVASDMMLFLCLSGYREWVAATSQAEANQIVAARSFLIPAPTTLDVEILAPAGGQSAVAGLPTTIRVQVDDDLIHPLFYEVTAEADNGNGAVILYDDGTHDDGDYQDGVYANSWTPVNEGPTTLDVHVGSCTIAGDAQVTVTVQALNYDVAVTHLVPLTGTTVLSSTYAPPPQTAVYGPDGVQIDWTHVLTAGHTSQQNSFDLTLSDMRPGELRQVASGTVISYTGPSGPGSIQLPPLYVAAQHLIAIDPGTQTANLGGRAVYQVSLVNPGPAESTMTLSVAGLPAGWATLTDTVLLAAGEQVMLPLTITIPAGASLGNTPFAVAVETESGGQDQAGATLQVADLLEVTVVPTVNVVDSGEVAPYSVTVTNLEPTERTYALSTAGLDGNVVVLSDTVTVGANSAVSVSMQVTAYANHGAHPIAVTATAVDANVSRDADAILQIVGDRRVAAALWPSLAIGGPGATTLYTLTVTNTGGLFDSYDISVTLPAGWSYQLQANGQPVDSLSLSPYLMNTADLSLMVTPATGSTPGDYDLNSVVQSQNNPTVSAIVEGELQVTEYGVQVEIIPPTTLMSPVDVGVWQVRITNTGSQADTYDLTVGSLLAYSGYFSTNPLSLAPGEQQSVQLTVDDLSFALPQTYRFEVAAESQFDDRIHNYDTAEVTLTGYEAVEVAWLPAEQVVTGTLTTTYMLLVTNTGNIGTVYQLGTSAPGLSARLQVDELIIPPHMTAGVLATVQAPAAGTYLITGTAVSAGSAVSAGQIATLTIIAANQPPTADAGPDQSAGEGALVSFSGSASDPNDDQLTIVWAFGDGATTSGVLTPTHSYGDDGVYTVALTVTDGLGEMGTDSLLVTVTNVAPVVDAGLDQVVTVGEPVTYTGTLTDAGWLDTHTILWDFGDGTTAAGALTLTHTYTMTALYTVTLTITDDDGGVGSDRLAITVRETPVDWHWIYLPLVLRQ